jgi:hypothetical protein
MFYIAKEHQTLLHGENNIKKQLIGFLLHVRINSQPNKPTMTKDPRTLKL